jgi:hypothetical protein
MKFELDSSLFVTLGIIIFIGIVLLLIISLSRRNFGHLNQQKYRTEWLKIENSLDKRNPMTYQMAIMTADKLLDRALRESGLSGETMGERLKTAQAKFSDINKVWTAHKLRNRIVHETDVKITIFSAKNTLYIYKKALKELGAI